MSLSQQQAVVISRLLFLSPSALARKSETTTAQARALQHYLVLTFVSAHKRLLGLPWEHLQMRAKALLPQLAPKFRRDIRDSLRM